MLIIIYAFQVFGIVFFNGHFRTLKSLDIRKSVWKFRVFKFFLVNRKGSYSTQSTSSEISYQKTSFRFIYAFKTMHISNYVFQKYIKVLFSFKIPKWKLMFRALAFCLWGKYKTLVGILNTFLFKELTGCSFWGQNKYSWRVVQICMPASLWTIAKKSVVKT